MDGNYTERIAQAFGNRPKQWGLRGDPFLWEFLENYFVDNRLPDTLAEFELKVIELFIQKTGKSTYEEEVVYIEDFAHGGMSSGQVDIQQWRENFIPLLMKNFHWQAMNETHRKE